MSVTNSAATLRAADGLQLLDDHVEAAGLDRSSIEEVVRDAPEPAGLAHDRLQVVVDHRVAELPAAKLQCLREAEQRRERGPELVGAEREEVVLGPVELAQALDGLALRLEEIGRDPLLLLLCT